MKSLILFWLLVFCGQPVPDIDPAGPALKPHVDPSNGAAPRTNAVLNDVEIGAHVDPNG